MSLLMQALRKAETAKKGQLAAEAEAAPASASAPAPAPELAPMSEPAAAAPAPAPPAAHAELTLESRDPLPEELAAPAVAVAEAPPAEPVDYFAGGDLPPRPSFVAPEPSTPQGFDPDKGFGATPPPAAPAAPAMPVDDIAPMPQDAAERRNASLAAPPPRLKMGLDDGKTSDAAAQKLAEARSAASAVFAAKQRVQKRRPIIIGVLGLLALSAAGAYGYYQYALIGKPASFVPVQPLPTPVAQAPLAAAPATVPVPAAAPVPVPAPATAAAPAPAASVPLAAAPLADKPAPAVPRAPRDGAPAVRTERTVRTVRAAPPAAPAEAIAVLRNGASSQVNPVLNDAYRAFMAGDTTAARGHYQRVLRQEADNRDALMGMAAIAISRGQAAEAGAFYARLLELDPTDAEAGTGLASIERSDPAQAESRLKKVLAASPNTASAHFALGNVYSQQSRWNEAQQAYFNAFAAAPGNADYAFNLAVSLERLGQEKLALDYYQKALLLAQQGGSNVNQVTVRERIRQLQAR